MNAERRTREPEDDPAGAAELVSRARQRTTEELALISSGLAPSYAAAISGNTPYATLPNGATIVMRKCHSWGC